MNGAAAYDHAWHTFVSGYLEASQQEAEQGYQRFQSSEVQLSRKFQLLEATAMAWRGLQEDVLRLMAEHQSRQDSRDTPGESIEALALESTALIRLNRMTEAKEKLALADRLCATNSAAECGSVLRSHGLFLLEQDQTGEAKRFFQKSLEFARAHDDRLLEGTALLNLGATASHQEHHDEALDLTEQAYRVATAIHAQDLAQSALGDEAWEYYSLGNSDKALEMFAAAQALAASLGDTRDEIGWLTAVADVAAAAGQFAQAEKSDLKAIRLAKQLNEKAVIVNASMDLAQVYIGDGRSEDADRYASEASAMAQDSGNQTDIMNCRLISGEAAALRHDWSRAESLLHEVDVSGDSQESMKKDAEHALARMYEAQGQPAAAEQSYKAALATVESARAEVKQEDSRLSFLTNAARIYDDYIHFLVGQGRPMEALEAADWSRARTLQQGLGVVPGNKSLKRPPLSANQVAQKAKATLLFYWMGERQSYLWAISGEKSEVVPLPAKNEVVPVLQRYRRALLDLKDPLRDGNKDGRALYEMLIASAMSGIDRDRPVILFADGELSQLNFETLVVPGSAPHYWIDDVTVLSAPSIRMVAAAMDRPQSRSQQKLLLLGDSVTADANFPKLPMASIEIARVADKFSLPDRTIFRGTQATPAAYLENKPEQFSYIHFVTHGIASRTDPLESSVILSPDNKRNNSYKLSAQEILHHPIDARLVTISACNSSGTKSYAGEGLVGLSWAFLRAGAHNVIGGLWEVSDASTPELMGQLYAGLEAGRTPAAALREAKLSLLHSGSKFAKPFYWAPFQLYAGR